MHCHFSCALWSSEVYEEVDGSLQNVPQALNRGPKLQCTYCEEKGATVGCCHENCRSNYHFECGLADGAAYKVRLVYIEVSLVDVKAIEMAQVVAHSTN